MDHSMEITILGFNITRSEIGVVEGDFSGKLFQKKVFDNSKDQTFENTYTNMIDEATNIIDASIKVGRNLKFISVSIEEPLEIESGIILSPPNLPIWHNVPLKDHLQESLKLPVFIETNGNAGALAEHRFGAGKGIRNMVFLTMGTGLSAGFILDNRLYRGTSNSAGEVGNIRLMENSTNSHRKPGSWEAMCSTSGLVNLAHGRYPGKWSTTITAEEIIQQALEDDPTARTIIEEMGEWLGRGIAILMDSLNPELVIVGELGVMLGDRVLEPARRVITQEALPASAQACQIVPAQLGETVEDVAALMAAINAAPEGTPSGYQISHTNVIQTLESAYSVREKTIDTLSEMICATSRVLIDALRENHKILVFGNGGSAAQALHLSAELIGKFSSERKPLPIIALPANTAVLSCIGNDYGFEEIFARQIDGLAESGDVVIGMTTSGESLNVLKGLEMAQNKGAITIALTGRNGILLPDVDYVLAIPADSTAHVQEEHLAVIHCWCKFIDAEFFKEDVR
jgi:glucokinase